VQKLFIGEHDFTSFNATPLEILPYQIRTIKRLDIIDEGEKVRLIFEGKGFLRYMVRMITQVLIEVGLNRLNQQMSFMFELNNKQACKLNAPAQGLYWWRCDMIANYHTHTMRCKHAVGTDEEYVLEAIKHGYKVLAFTDHSPWPLTPV
jgi:tRNA U38,U39,U40 pseudouridine synthase TruA